MLGGNWLARIGILALIFGDRFLSQASLRQRLDRRNGAGVVLGLVTGLALLGGGEYWSRRYAAWARAVTGGGIAILYLSIFTAFSLYHSDSGLGHPGGVPPGDRGRGIRSGFALRVPGCCRAGNRGRVRRPAACWPVAWPSSGCLLAYVLVLDLGVLALAAFRNWRWFTLLGLVGSLILFGFWKEELDPSLLLAQVGITVIFLIFVGRYHPVPLALAAVRGAA